MSSHHFSCAVTPRRVEAASEVLADHELMTFIPRHAGIFRYFTNQTNPPFIRDPFHHIILEEKGEIAKHDLKRKVTFAELFYDLFVVAALTVFSREDGLATGPDLASYIIFFAALWAVWASQTVFDVSVHSNHNTWYRLT